MADFGRYLRKFKSAISVTLVPLTQGTSARGYSISTLRVVLLFAHNEQFNYLLMFNLEEGCYQHPY